MAQETIEAIRQAELAAEQNEKDAARQAEQVLANARDEAAKLKVSLTREAREKALKAEEEAKAKGDQFLTDALHQVEQELESLKTLAAEREGQAVKAVLSELI